MSASLQASKIAQPKTVPWESMFPGEQVTEQRSALFVKKLLAVAISNITYLRGIFPEGAYGNKGLEDLNLKILRDESAFPGACQVIKWVKGTFDALDKKYLKNLVIGIYLDPNNPETVIESYTFKFTYDSDGTMDIYRNEQKVSSTYTAEETKKATKQLLRTLVVLTNTLNPLPSHSLITMKLFYYDEVTPANYEPPGFVAAPDGGYVFDGEAANIAVGSVSTNFHSMKLRLKTQSATVEAGQEHVTMEQALNDPDNLESDELRIRRTPRPTPRLNRANEKGDFSTGKTPVAEEEFKVRCPCGCSADDGLMVMCAVCGFWQHGVCFLITNEIKAPETHICDICAKQDPSLPSTDPTLNNLSSIDVQGTCLWRRAITVCQEYTKVVAPEFAKRLGIENTVAQGLVNRLEKEGFLNKQTKGKKKQLGKTVNKQKLINEAIPKYLKTPQILAANINKQDDTKMEFSMDETVDFLANTTQQMNLQNTLACDKLLPPESPSKAKGRKKRKRSHSKISSADFEFTSQEDEPAAAGASVKKKASKAKQDVTLG